MKRLALLAPLVSLAVLSAQTRITPPKNSYPIEQDVQLGREAAQQAEKELPIMRDDEVTSYVERIGERLVDAFQMSISIANFSTRSGW
jgi:predicted Zn-dependent protease